jgi:hypothetical protein
MNLLLVNREKVEGEISVDDFGVKRTFSLNSTFARLTLIFSQLSRGLQ